MQAYCSARWGAQEIVLVPSPCAVGETDLRAAVSRGLCWNRLTLVALTVAGGAVSAMAVAIANSFDIGVQAWGAAALT